MFLDLGKFVRAYALSLALILLSPALSVGGEEKKTVEIERWPLSKIIQRSAENAPVLKAATQDAVAAESKAYQAGRWDNPEVSATLGKKTVGAASGRTVQLSLLQSIPLFGQKAINEKIGLQGALVAQTDKAILSLAFQHEVIRRAFRLAAVDEQLKHVSHRRERIRLVEGYLRSRPFASPSQVVEKNLIENRLREIEERFLQVQSSREQQWESLNVFLGLASPIAPSVSWYSNPSLPDRSSLSQKTDKDNLELSRQKSVLSSTELEIEQAGKKAFPEIRLGGGFSEETADAPEKNYFGMLQLSIPILDAGGYGKEAARAKRNAEEQRLEQRKREISSQFGQAWAELLQSKGRVQIFPLELVSKLELEMNRTEKDWKKGLIPVTGFLEMESQVHEQAAKIFDSQVSFVNSLSQVLLLSGQNFPAGEK